MKNKINETEESELERKHEVRRIARILERLRLGVPRIERLEIVDGVAIIDVPPFTMQPNESLRQRAFAAETGLSGGELATLSYLCATDREILELAGCELTVRVNRIDGAT